jgi:hypothetical protein
MPPQASSRPLVRRLVALLALGIAFGGGREATASEMDNPPELPGWTHAPAFLPGDSPGRQGILLSGTPVVRSSPTIAEIDGNTEDGREVAVGGGDGILYVYGADGQLRWSVNVLPTPCDVSTNLMIGTQPTVGDLDGDGTPEVVVGYGGETGSNCDGGIAVYEGPTGQLAWRFSLRAWQDSEGNPPEGLYGVLSSPAIADTEGDGRLEIAFGGLDRNVYMLDHDGSVRWYYHAADTVVSSPVFANVDDDPQLELVVGADISANQAYGTTDGGWLYAFDTQARFPLRIEFGTGYLWRTSNLGQTIWSSPSIGDVLPDEPGAEIVIGSGCFFPGGNSNKSGKWVKIFRARDGVELQTLNAPAGGACVQSSPALGDIDDDGKLEVVVTMGWIEDSGSDGLSRIVAWDPETPTPKWSMVPHSPSRPPLDPVGNDQNGGDLQSAVIADLDGNGSLEVLAANFWSVVVLDGRNGTPLTCQDTACGPQPSLFAWATLKSTPAIGDVDMDGRLDVVIGGFHYYAPPNRGVLYGWTGFDGVLGSRPGLQPPYSAPWPTFRGLPASPGSGGKPPGGGPCDAFAPDSLERLACDLDTFRRNPPCQLSTRTNRQLQRAGSSLLQLASEDWVRMKRRLFRRTAVALKRARRAAKRVVPCGIEVQESIETFLSRLASTGAL